jgi:multiple sugar transport system substrate-binding protein
MTPKLTRRAALSGLGVLAGRPARAQVVQIEYWQYFFKERVAAMDTLIARFQAANPGITIRQTTFPYAQYRTKLSAAVPAGEGPDLLQLYHGWVRDFRRAKLIQPLPADVFNPAAVARDFHPMVALMHAEGSVHALPTAVRSLGLFTNRRLLREAGQDPAAPPATLDAHLAAAQAVSRRDAGGNLLIAGTTIGLPSQDSHWWREVLVRQFGGAPFDADSRRVTYGSPEGAEALVWYADLEQRHRVAQAGFMTEAAPAFRSGRVGLLINGSFLAGALQATRGLDWSAAELPSRNGIRANNASYWVTGLAAGRDGARRDAALRFLAYLTSPEAMVIWTRMTGELPARPDVAALPEFRDDAVLGPFARGLAYASATDFVNEDAQREVFVAMLDRVLLKGQAPLDAVREAQAAEQRILDDYYTT